MAMKVRKGSSPLNKYNRQSLRKGSGLNLNHNFHQQALLQQQNFPPGSAAQQNNNLSPSNFYRQSLNRVKTSSPAGSGALSSIKSSVIQLNFNNNQNHQNLAQQINGLTPQQYNKNYLIDQQNKLSVDGFSDYSNSKVYLQNIPQSNLPQSSPKKLSYYSNSHLPNQNFNSLNLQKVQAFQSNQASNLLQNNYNSSNSRDNTRITVINAHNNSVASTIYNINGATSQGGNGGQVGAFTSQMTLNDSKINHFNSMIDNSVLDNSTQQLMPQNADLKAAPLANQKAPLIPSLKTKIYQTVLSQNCKQPQTNSKSGNRMNQLTGITGLMTTYDEKLGVHQMPSSSKIIGDQRSNSRGGQTAKKRSSIHYAHHAYTQSGYSILFNQGQQPHHQLFLQAGNHHSSSISNINPLSVGGRVNNNNIFPLMTSPTVAMRGVSSREEFISNQDIASIVEFKRKEEQNVNDYYYAGLPYLQINHSLIIDYQDRENINKRMIYSNIEELDRAVSDKNLKYLRDKGNPSSFSDWLCDMSLKCQRNKLPQDN